MPEKLQKVEIPKRVIVNASVLFTIKKIIETKTSYKINNALPNQGDFGKVFYAESDDGGSVICKITKMPLEAAAASEIQKIDFHDGLPDVYDTFKIKIKGEWYYVIFMEELQQISHYDKKFLQYCKIDFSVIGFSGTPSKYYDFSQDREVSLKKQFYLMDFIRAYALNDKIRFVVPEYKQNAKTISQLVELIKTWSDGEKAAFVEEISEFIYANYNNGAFSFTSIISGIDFLKNNDIFHADIAIRNIMQGNSGIVLIDYGFSMGKEKDIPELNESRLIYLDKREQLL
jgi:serine/threonine protein kinase